MGLTDLGRAKAPPEYGLDAELAGEKSRVVEARADRYGVKESEPPEDYEPPESEPEPVDLAIDGASFVLDQPDNVQALWGKGDDVLWSPGEALMIAGAQGLCKTTLAGLLVRAQMGLSNDVLDLPVLATKRRILYLAMDRPRQIARSLRRQFTEDDRDLLAERLIVRPGPPPADLAANPLLLAGMAERYDAGIVYLDSLKDAALGLSADEVGAAYNRARQYLLLAGVELCELHHMVKRGPTGGPPKDIADVYGSAWLTNGCGSVVLLTGDPGDPIIGFRHAKQPIEEIGPFQLLHDSAEGRLSVYHEADLVALVRAKGVDGLTARDAAVVIFEDPKPSKAVKEKARRRLDKLVPALLIRHTVGDTTAWFLAAGEGTGGYEKQ